MKSPFANYNPGPQIEDGDYLCLHRNENLLIGSYWDDISAQLVQTVKVSSYPDPKSEALREALGEMYGVSAACVFVGNGADEVVADLLALLRSQFDELNLLDVCFGVYPVLADRMAFRTRILPGKTFETGRIGLPPRPSLTLVDSPNAITGTRITSDVLQAQAQDANSYLIWDNVYGEYAGDKLPQPLPPNTAFVRSFSKFYGLAGLRIGFCIAAADVVQELLRRKDAFNVNAFGQAVALEALHRQHYFEEVLSDTLGARSELERSLESLGFLLHDSSSISVLATHPRHAADWIERELIKRRIVVRRFPNTRAANHIRITVPPMSGVRRLVEALSAMLDSE